MGSTKDFPHLLPINLAWTVSIIISTFFNSPGAECSLSVPYTVPPSGKVPGRFFGGLHGLFWAALGDHGWSWKTGRSHRFLFLKVCSSSWWLNQPIWKIWVKMGIFPNFRVKIKKYLKPPPSRLLAGKLTCRPSKSMYGRCLSYGNGSLFGRHARFRGCNC